MSTSHFLYEKAADEIKSLKSRVQQLEVQLAGCATAAQGWSKGENAAKQGDYGWSPAYQDVVDLRNELERLRETLKGAG